MKDTSNHQKNLPQHGTLERTQLRISYFLKILIVFAIVFSFFEMNLFLIASSMIILIFSALPALVEREFKIILPIEVDLVLTIFVFLHFILGEVENYYNRFWWFDLLLHISSGILIGLVGFVIIYYFLYTRRVTANPVIVSVFSVSFSLAAGALWEIFEFLMDMTFGFNMQKSGLVDTMSDLLVDFLGACIVGVAVYRYLKKESDGIIKTLVYRFIKYSTNKKQLSFRKIRKKSIPDSAQS